jgi:hypothetical protein
MTRLTGVSSFTWSTSEQVYPFEKDSSGNTLYCQMVNLGALPNAGITNVYPATTVAPSKVFKVWGFATEPSVGQTIPLPFASSAGNSNVEILFNGPSPGFFYVQCPLNNSSFTGKGYVIYSK